MDVPEAVSQSIDTWTTASALEAKLAAVTFVWIHVTLFFLVTITCAGAQLFAAHSAGDRFGFVRFRCYFAVFAFLLVKCTNLKSKVYNLRIAEEFRFMLKSYG